MSDAQLQTMRQELLEEVAASVRAGADAEHIAGVLTVLDAVDARRTRSEADVPPSVERRMELAARGPSMQRRASRAARA